MRTRIVVLGGAGFLGSHLCDRLVGDRHEVVCVDNLSTGSPANVEHLVGAPNFTFVEADVAHPLQISGRVDAVLHLASPASPADYLRLPLETLRAGSLGTFHGLELAVRKDARFVLASTSEVYGDPAEHPQPESYWGNVNPVGPRSCYDEAKRFAEAATTAYRRALGGDTCIVRIFNTYGPRMRPGDGRAIPNFIHQALRGEPLTVAGDGRQTRSFCYVDDLVDGLVRAVHGTATGPVNLGNPVETTILELAELVRRITGTASGITFVPRPQDDPYIRRPDISRARAELGWQPGVDLGTGLAATVSWVEQSLARAVPAGVPDRPTTPRGGELR
ncbi:UDP-glucuronic acid decarboxylase family protein [Kitasatospora sp. NPDC101447]|uniref:UDP-glucuronic acid decarboxylase family protein n=1 Tax=Kitasatospora sp. NPDC101447 TaxID=3364102 RepID=UPI0037F8AEDD